MILCVLVRTVCDVAAQPFLFFVVKHTHGKDQDKSDASDQRTSYDTCEIVCKMTKMFDEIRLEKTFPQSIVCTSFRHFYQTVIIYDLNVCMNIKFNPFHDSSLSPCSII